MRFPLKFGSSPAITDGEARVNSHVTVRGGYAPSTIVARAGQPLRVTFTREETAPCSERVVFPDFGIAADLPPDEHVVVDLLPERQGEHEFTCGMGMLHGRLVVLPARPGGLAAA